MNRVEPDAIAGGTHGGSGPGARGPLAVGARDEEGPQLPLGMSEIRRRALHPVQAEPDGALSERRQGFQPELRSQRRRLFLLRWGYNSR